MSDVDFQARAAFAVCQDEPLPLLFQRARALLKQLEAHPSSDPRIKQLVEQGAACLQQAAAVVHSLALFSSNEELDDLATPDIKYLLIPFYQAQLLTHTHGDDPHARLAALTFALEQYKSFLHRCHQYGILSPPANALAEVALQQGGEDGSKSTDAANLRQRKIEKFKREKYVKGQLEALEARRRHASSTGGAEGGDDADEAEREVWLLQVDLAGMQAADHILTLQQEVAILRHATAMPEEQRQQQQQQPPDDLLHQLRTAAGSLAGAAAQRERLAADVFRPSHVLPTMSVEQFGELEFRRMLEQQQREAEAKERHERWQAERHPDELEEEELLEQRAWDEFKDDNPRGWGNSKLRPCS